MFSKYLTLDFKITYLGKIDRKDRKIIDIHFLMLFNSKICKKIRISLILLKFKLNLN